MIEVSVFTDELKQQRDDYLFAGKADSNSLPNGLSDMRYALASLMGHLDAMCTIFLK